MFDESIQRLGRWSSKSFKLYFTTSSKTLFNLNLSFQKGMLLAVPRAVVQAAIKSPWSAPNPAGTKDPYVSPYPPLSTINF